MDCCCGHSPELHLGGIEIETVKALADYRLKHPGGDGGMCRVSVNGKRCNCFNFCDCHTVTADDE